MPDEVVIDSPAVVVESSVNQLRIQENIYFSPHELLLVNAVSLVNRNPLDNGPDALLPPMPPQIGHQKSLQA